MENIFVAKGEKFSNLFFCHYVFKKPSAAVASESVYMRERVKLTYRIVLTSIFGSSSVPRLFIKYVIYFMNSLGTEGDLDKK